MKISHSSMQCSKIIINVTKQKDCLYPQHGSPSWPHTLLGSIFSVLTVHIFHPLISVFHILRDCVLPFNFTAGYSYPSRIHLLLKMYKLLCHQVEGLSLTHTACSNRGADAPPLHLTRVVLPSGCGHGWALSEDMGLGELAPPPRLTRVSKGEGNMPFLIVWILIGLNNNTLVSDIGVKLPDQRDKEQFTATSFLANSSVWKSFLLLPYITLSTFAVQGVKAWVSTPWLNFSFT